MKYNLHLEASEKEFPLDPGLQVRLSVCPKFPPVQEPTYNLKAGKFLMAFELLLLLKSQNMDFVVVDPDVEQMTKYTFCKCL